MNFHLTVCKILRSLTVSYKNKRSYDFLQAMNNLPNTKNYKNYLFFIWQVPFIRSAGNVALEWNEILRNIEGLHLYLPDQQKNTQRGYLPPNMVLRRKVRESAKIRKFQKIN
jgi:hypothetical protein